MRMRDERSYGTMMVCPARIREVGGETEVRGDEHVSKVRETDL